jgi:hypothetical protein
MIYDSVRGNARRQVLEGNNCSGPPWMPKLTSSDKHQDQASPISYQDGHHCMGLSILNIFKSPGSPLRKSGSLDTYTEL